MVRSSCDGDERVSAGTPPRGAGARWEHPLLLVDEVADEALELGRVLDAVLRLAEDEAEQPVLAAEMLQDGAVV